MELYVVDYIIKMEKEESVKKKINILKLSFATAFRLLCQRLPALPVA